MDHRFCNRCGYHTHRARISSGHSPREGTDRFVLGPRRNCQNLRLFVSRTLQSATPRPYILPSMISAPNGATFQSSSLPTGAVSIGASKHVIGPGSPESIVAKMPTRRPECSLRSSQTRPFCVSQIPSSSNMGSKLALLAGLGMRTSAFVSETI
jgi:hypothetical protein